VCVRVSVGSFDPAHADSIAELLSESGLTLIPALKRLTGLRHYHAGIDREAGAMVNVSVWDNLQAAQQMNTLVEMASAAKAFISAGVQFERPIKNYETVWSI